MTTRPCQIGAAGLASAKIVKNATLEVYPGAPHGMTDTHKEQRNADLPAFIKGWRSRREDVQTISRTSSSDFFSMSGTHAPGAG